MNVILSGTSVESKDLVCFKTGSFDFAQDDSLGGRS